MRRFTGGGLADQRARGLLMIGTPIEQHETPVLVIEIDTVMGRAGVRSVDDAVALARLGALSRGIFPDR